MNWTTPLTQGAEAPNRPLVRLLFDAQGAPLPEGIEIDMRTQPDDTDLIAIPEEGVSVEEYAHRLASAAATTS